MDHLHALAADKVLMSFYASGLGREKEFQQKKKDNEIASVIFSSRSSHFCIPNKTMSLSFGQCIDIRIHILLKSLQTFLYFQSKNISKSKSFARNTGLFPYDL